MKIACLNVVCLIFNIGVLSFTLHPHSKMLKRNDRRWIMTIESGSKTETTDDFSSDTAKLSTAVEQLAIALKNGKEKELRKAGIHLSQLNSKEQTLEDKVDDVIFQDKIFGTTDDEDDLEIRKLFQQKLSEIDNEEQENHSYSANDLELIDEIDEEMIKQLTSEAKKTMEKILNTENTDRYDDERNNEDFDSDQFSSFAAATTSFITPTEEIPGVVKEDILPFSNPNLENIGIAPPTPSPGALFEEEEISEESSEESSTESFVEEDSISNLVEAVLNKEISKKPVEKLKTLDVESEESEKDEAMNTMNTAVFSQLLKDSIDQISEESGNKEGLEGIISNTVTAVGNKDFAALDLKSILGSTLGSLSEQLGVESDLENELKSSSDNKLKADLQKLMERSIQELSNDMKQLDEESLNLYGKLETLKIELEEETKEFEEKKQLELDELLKIQAGMQKEYIESKSIMEGTTKDLESIVNDIQQNADVITSLAMFPMRSITQKIALVLALVITLKIPFDIWYLTSIRSDEFTDWFTVFTETALGVTCLDHYGLLRAISISLGGKK